MKKLLSIVNDEYTLNKIGKTKEELEKLLNETSTDGFEILKTDSLDKSIFPEGSIIGRHLYFYPMWMDLFTGNEKGIIDDFSNLENAHNYYECKDKEGFIKKLKEEFKDCEKDGFTYAVMHVSHMSIEEAYTYNYSYKSKEIALAFCELINKAMDGENFTFQLLLENNWYPGLTFLEKDVLEILIENIEYKNTAFLLDTGHLVNTNREIKNSEEAIKYLNKVIDNLGEYKNYIEAIHLNVTYSGEYSKKIQKENKYKKEEPYEKRMSDAMVHVGLIDNHEVFSDNYIGDFVRKVNPKYLVFEIKYKDKEDLITKVKEQTSYILPIS